MANPNLGAIPNKVWKQIVLANAYETERIVTCISVWKVYEGLTYLGADFGF